jgi:hypothetical protein
MAQFGPGDRVRIAERYPEAHHRVPNYAKGAVGQVERVCEAFGQPESLAVGGDGEPLQTLYRVRLSQSVLWPDYSGAATDTLDIEVFEHWLEPEE